MCCLCLCLYVRLPTPTLGKDLHTHLTHLMPLKARESHLRGHISLDIYLKKYLSHFAHVRALSLSLSVLSLSMDVPCTTCLWRVFVRQACETHAAPLHTHPNTHIHSPTRIVCTPFCTPNMLRLLACSPALLLACPPAGIHINARLLEKRPAPTHLHEHKQPMRRRSRPRSVHSNRTWIKRSCSASPLGAKMTS